MPSYYYWPPHHFGRCGVSGKYIGLVVQNIMSARFPFHIDFRDTGKDWFQKIHTANQNPDSVNYVYNRGTSIVPLVYKRRWVGGSKMSTSCQQL